MNGVGFALTVNNCFCCGGGGMGFSGALKSLLMTCTLICFCL